ncbi:MAG: tRNA uridine(34) 5-carboxymethylaminomethyl modification radical SAM/GNAT enzyme Elp3 [Candidatus Woesearchaeota archaeon]
MIIEFLDRLQKIYLEKGTLDNEIIEKIKRELAKKYQLNEFPPNYEIWLSLSEKERKKYSNILKFLKRKPTRTESGVTPVAVMTEPFPCPHGRCIMCPGGKDSVFGDVPQSYTGKEPATSRAIRNKFDPYLQVFNRLQQYAINLHNFQKVEVIVMGGTFLSYPENYQEEFIKNIYKALNDFSDLFITKKNSLNEKKFIEFFEMQTKKETNSLTEKILSLKNKNQTSLVEEQKRNEKSRIRCVALCIETRPDFCLKEHINKMLNYGTTRVEIGVQALDDEILKIIERGHDVKTVIKATQLAKDSFLKVTYHMMLGLPGSSYEKDLNMFKKLFDDENFRPDALKIYPCEVIKGTKLYEMWRSGKYNALELDKTIDLLIRIKQIIPKYCRIMRIQRDIPSNVIDAGIKVTNLRQILNNTINELLEIQETENWHKLKDININLSNELLEMLKNKKLKRCECIRCREISRRKIDPKNIKIEFNQIRYKASKGEEIFLELVEKNTDSLIGFARIRKPYAPFRPEIDNDTLGIRQLHVYGESLNISEKSEKSFQHRGFGRSLVMEAERIAKEEFQAKKMCIISGVGVREYYRKIGYSKQGVYMVKKI